MNEKRQAAFTAWCESGQNIVEAVAILEDKYDYITTRQTMATWRDKYSWEQRAAQMELERQKLTDKTLTLDEELLADLLEQKDRYDAYFDSLKRDKVDTQAMYAYTRLCTLIRDIYKEIRPAKTKKQSKKGLLPQTASEIRKEILGVE